MRIPKVGSVIRVRTQYSQGPRMIPPQSDHTIHEGKVLPPYKWLNSHQFCLSGDADWPIRVINMNYVDKIDIINGDFLEVDTGVKVWEVAGSKGNKYVVTRNKSGWNCTCPGFSFRRQCKHVSELSLVK